MGESSSAASLDALVDLLAKRLAGDVPTRFPNTPGSPTPRHERSPEICARLDLISRANNAG